MSKPKELYLYQPIYDSVVEGLMQQMEDADGGDIILRINSGGGRVKSGWGLPAKMNEHTGKITVKVDGMAMSMAAVIMLYADEVEALDISDIMLHRADAYVETPEDQAWLNRINADLKSKMLKRVDSVKLKEMTGFSVDDMFNPEGKRVDIFLSAKQAKALGLVDRIVKLDPAEQEAFSDRFAAVAASYNKNASVMTPEEFKTKFPEAHKKMIDDAVAAHTAAEATKTTVPAASVEVTKERARVSAWMKFKHIDATAVEKGIESGAEVTSEVLADFTAKALSPEKLAALAKAQPDQTGEGVRAEAPGAVTEKDKSINAFQADVDKALGRTKKA